MTITLITALLILIHTNFKLQNVQWQMLFTASDCYVSELDQQQVQKLIKRDDLAWYTIEEKDYKEYHKGKQYLLFERGDDAFITMTGKIEQGRMPRKSDEVVVERWTLLNLGVKPKIGEEFDISDGEKQVHVRLVGILSDQLRNKKYGLKCIYSTMTMQGEEYNVFLRLKDGDKYDEVKKEIINTFHLKKKQISECPGRMDTEKLAKIDAALMSALIVICLIVFYGIYHIGMVSRRKEYGILHAIGMKRKQIRRLVLAQLYEIYGISIVFGIGIGYAITAIVVHLSGDNKKNIYLSNAKVSFQGEFPILQIGLCLLIIAVFIGVIGCIESRRMERAPLLSLLSTSYGNGKRKSKHFFLREQYSKHVTLLLLGIKYIFRDRKTSLFVVLTVCVGVTLFTSLSYEHTLSRTNREKTKEMFYLNGQYEMASAWVGSVFDGISREDAKKLNAMNNVTNIKTAAGMPVRVVDNKKVKRNDAYYNDMNKRKIKNHADPIMGNDGTEDVYKTIFYGYNKNALKELKKYLVEGEIDEDGLKPDEIILSVLSMDGTKNSKYPGYYKEGIPLMDYHVGDHLQMKYRSDFKTDNAKYNELKDQGADYVYKDLKVKAIVSFPYMSDPTITVFPLLITSDNNIQALCSDSHVQQIYLDGVASFNKSQQAALEEQLITLGNKSENISTRSLISDIENNEMLYQKQIVYIIGIAIIAFILVIINMITNLKFRMYTRTKEICMFRAIGMSIKMIRKMVLMENVVLFIAGSLFSYALLQPILRILHRQSDLKQYGYIYHFQYAAYFGIVVVAIVFCILLSISMTKDWKTKRIMEKMDERE